MNRVSRIITAGAFVGALLLIQNGCTAGSGTRSEMSGVYRDPESAVHALKTALERNDRAALLDVLGERNIDVYTSGDPVADAQGRKEFLRMLTEGYSLSKEGESATLTVGKEEWPFPVPLRMSRSGWYFDTDAGKEEILNRRIGRNELSAIQSVRAYAEAQEEYAAEDLDGDGTKNYAAKLMSAAGKRDGLFWPRRPGEPQSPLGPLMAQAVADGYPSTKDTTGPHPFRGYIFRQLTKQGPGAPGGERSYLSPSGKLTGGFALIAYPVEWGNSGVMTFLIGKDGVVYEKNLGEETSKIASTVEKYDPREGWDKVQEN